MCYYTGRFDCTSNLKQLRNTYPTCPPGCKANFRTNLVSENIDFGDCIAYTLYLLRRLGVGALSKFITEPASITGVQLMADARIMMDEDY